MNKFPAMSLYKGFANFVAILLILAGLFFGYQAATGFRGFNFFNLLGGFLPFFIAAVAARFLAELLDLAMRVEEHLESISQTLRTPEKSKLGKL